MSQKNKIGLGTVQFGMNYGISNAIGQTPEHEVKKVLNFAKQNSITLIDTASAYGNAEEILGRNDLTGFRVISKFMPPSTKEKITIQLEQSLKKLNLFSLYAYLAHRPLELLNHSEQWEELTNLKKEGKIEKIGYSINHTDELEQLLRAGMFPDLIQVPFNYFDNRFKYLMIKLKKNGCEVHTRSTFLQGLFFMDTEQLPDYFDEVKEAIFKLQMTFKENLSGFLLKHVLEFDFIDIVIMGIENQNQLKENLNNIDEVVKIPFSIPEVDEKIVTPSMWPKL